MTVTIPRHPPAEIDARAAVILVACCAMWGFGLVMVKTANTGISPMLNCALRSVCAGVLLLLWTRARGVSLFQRDRTLAAGLLCGVTFAVEFMALYPGLALTQVARATIFLHCAPFVAAYGEHLFVPGHRLTRIKVAGLCAAFTGLAVALSDGLADLSLTTLTGDLLCLLGGVAWGGTTVIIRASALRTAAAEKTLLYQLGVSIPILLAASWLWGEAGITNLSSPVLAAFAYTVIGTVAVGYTIWFWLMRTYSAASLHAFTFLTPIFGVLAGHFVLGEKIGPAILIGLSLVAFGIWLVAKPARAIQ